MKRNDTLSAAHQGGRKWLMLCTAVFLTIVNFAQEKKADININTKEDSGNDFFDSPVVWVIGAAVFILLLVALVRDNSGRRADV